MAKVLRGPDGIRVELVAMVYYRGGSATLPCALGEGEVETGLEGLVIPLPRDVYSWLESVEQEADKYLE